MCLNSLKISCIRTGGGRCNFHKITITEINVKVLVSYTLNLSQQQLPKKSLETQTIARDKFNLNVEVDSFFTQDEPD